LFDILKECKSLTIVNIDLSENKLDDNFIQSLGELLLQNSQSIKVIKIASNKLTNKGIEKLLPYLIGNKILKKLDISNNKKITKKSFILLNEIIDKSTIEDINIKETTIGEEKSLTFPLAINIIKNGTNENLNIHGWFVYNFFYYWKTIF